MDVGIQRTDGLDVLVLRGACARPRETKRLGCRARRGLSNYMFYEAKRMAKEAKDQRK